MQTPRSRTASVDLDEALRLPRPPGLIRRFWQRHPRTTDALVALLYAFLSVPFLATLSAADQATDAGAAAPVILVATSIACLLLLWRRRLPLIAFIGSIVAASTLMLYPYALGSPLLLITTYSLAVYRSARTCTIASSIGVGALVVTSIALHQVDAISTSVMLNTILPNVVLALIGALIGVNVGNRRRYVDAIIARSRQLLQERDQQAALAAAAERTRIARELHDIVSHSLTVVVALSEGALATDDQERSRAAVTASAATARSALIEMRSMLGVLRENDGDAPLAPSSIAPPEQTVADAVRAGLPVTLRVRGVDTSSQTVRAAIGRIVQEGVTNVMRHAPAATRVEVRIAYEPHRTVIDIVNDGVRPATAKPGFGLRGLTERVEHVGGVFTSSPAGERGWALHAELPGAGIPGLADDNVEGSST